jgi:hypothetical protein
MLENSYKTNLCRRIREILPDCQILHLDPNEVQGIPDILILQDEHWAMLEVKKNEEASRRPNQVFYVNKFNHIGFASFIYPENEFDVLNKMHLYFIHREEEN